MRGTGNHTAPTVHQPAPTDNTSPYINQQITTWRATQTLVSPDSAREIAAWFATAHHPGLVGFATAGRISPNVRREVRAELEEHIADSQPYVRGSGVDWDREALAALNAYLEFAT